MSSKHTKSNRYPGNGKEAFEPEVMIKQIENMEIVKKPKKITKPNLKPNKTLVEEAR